MKSLIYSFVAALLVTGVVWGAGELATPTRGNTPSQMFAPKGDETQTLTKATRSINGANYVHYGFRGLSTCSMVTSPVAWQKGSTIYWGYDNRSSLFTPYVKTPLPATTWHIRGINRETPFLIFSGCKSGIVELQ